jgi:glycosyltransferase involved in cell wall biosynthesis
MHILIIPSEEYVPAHAPMAGIFQRHQIEALRATAGQEKLGVLSIRLRHSLPMYLKTLAFRLIGRRASNALDEDRICALLTRLWSYLAHPGRAARHEESEGVPVTRIEGLYLSPPSDRHDHAWWCRLGRAGYRAYTERYGKPDLIHAHNTISAGLLARQIKRDHGVPYVLSEHSSAYHQRIVPTGLFPEVRRAMEEAEAIMPVSAALARSMEAVLGTLPKTAQITGNVVPPFFTQPVKRAPRTAPFKLLTVGSLLPIKNQSALLDALSSVDGPVLRIVGDGPLRPSLEEQTDRLGLRERVTFTGQLDESGVRDELLQADALIFPSAFETFGVVLIEAMACGLPVIAMASGGPQEVITSTTGRLVQPGDEAGLISALRSIMHHPDQFDPETIRTEVINRYGADTFCRSLRSIYQTVGKASLS